MTSPEYKLIYLNLRVLGEPIRFIFHVAGIPFEDVRIELDKWPELKAVTGWGKLPLLQFDGQEVSQSAAIARHLAKKYNLGGATDLESAKCDEYVEAAKDWRQEWRLFWFETDPVRKAEIKKNLLEVVFPQYLGNYNRILEANGGNSLVGTGVTWADFYITVFIELFEDTVDPNILDPYPILKEYKRSVFSIPQIKAWIDRRPKSKF